MSMYIYTFNDGTCKFHKLTFNKARLNNYFFFSQNLHTGAWTRKFRRRKKDGGKNRGSGEDGQKMRTSARLNDELEGDNAQRITCLIKMENVNIGNGQENKLMTSLY